MGPIPKSVRDAAATAIYARLDDIKWETLGNAERSDEYARMLIDPHIGGLLSTYMDPGRIRVWIKDGPAKEYRRALEGIGPYADVTTRTLGKPDRIVTAALGHSWHMKDGTRGEKPMRCRAVGPDGQERFLVWGSPEKISDLVWHAVRERAERPENTPLIVVTRPGGAPLPPGEWGIIERICDVIGARCVQVLQEAARKPRPSDPPSGTVDR